MSIGKRAVIYKTHKRVTSDMGEQLNEFQVAIEPYRRQCYWYIFINKWKSHEIFKTVFLLRIPVEIQLKS